MDESRILITIDKDFGEFLFVYKQRHAGLVRLPDVPARERIELMEKLLVHHGHELSERAIVTVRGNRIRITHVV